MIDGNVYRDILYFINFIQNDYANLLRMLYPNENTNILQMPFLYTTYKINYQGKILTILH